MEVSINTSQTVNLGQWQRSVSSVWGLQFRYVICFKIWAWVPWTHFPVHYWSHGFSFFSSLQGGRSPGCGKESSRICLCPQAFHLKFWDEGHSLDQIWCSLKEKKKKKNPELRSVLCEQNPPWFLTLPCSPEPKLWASPWQLSSKNRSQGAAVMLLSSLTQEGPVTRGDVFLAS